MSGINSIIENLQKLNDEKVKSFKLPCSKLKVKLKPFQAKHNTDVNSSLVAGSDGTYTIKFTQLLKKLFDELLEIEDGTYADIPQADIHYLVLKIRESISDVVYTNVSNEDKREEVKLVVLLERFEKAKIKNKVVTVKGDNGLEVDVCQPSFETNIFYDKILMASHEKFSEKNSEKVVKDAMVFTLLKFIKSVRIKIDNQIQDIQMSHLSAMDRRAIISNMPNDMYKQIMETINEITDPIEQILRIDDDNSVVIDQTILMDVKL